MNKDEGPADLLVEVIGEFRLELIEWIDCQLNLLCDREAWPVAESAGALAPAKVLASLPESPATPAPSTDARIVPPRSRPADVEQLPAQVDSRNRLDAVARRLGERLRLAEESRKGPEREPRTDVPEDPHRPPR